MEYILLRFTGLLCLCESVVYVHALAIRILKGTRREINEAEECVRVKNPQVIFSLLSICFISLICFLVDFICFWFYLFYILIYAHSLCYFRLCHMNENRKLRNKFKRKIEREEKKYKRIIYVGTQKLKWPANSSSLIMAEMCARKKWKSWGEKKKSCGEIEESEPFTPSSATRVVRTPLQILYTHSVRFP